jgi:hypothetical protein
MTHMSIPARSDPKNAMKGGVSVAQYRTLYIPSPTTNTTNPGCDKIYFILHLQIEIAVTIMS